MHVCHSFHFGELLLHLGSLLLGLKGLALSSEVHLVRAVECQELESCLFSKYKVPL